MKKSLIGALALIVGLGSTSSLAAPKAAPQKPSQEEVVETSLQEKAVIENADPTPKVIIKEKRSESLTPVIPESAIRLDDDFTQAKTRGWDWTVTFGLQPYKPQAKADFAGIQTYDTSAVGSTLMPSLSFGFIRDLNQEKTWSLGTYAKMAFARQYYNLITLTGESSEVHLDTFMFSLKPYLKYSFTSRWSLLAGAEWGQYQLNQGAQYSLARWSQASGLSGGFITAAYNLNRAWSLALETSFHKLAKSTTDLQLSSNSTTLQTEYRW